MLISVNSQLHRRRRARWALAVLAVSAATLMGHAALMDGFSAHAMSNAAAVCVAVGFVAVAVFAIRRVLQRPTYIVTPLLVWAPEPIRPAGGVPVRAGPPLLLPVLRL